MKRRIFLSLLFLLSAFVSVQSQKIKSAKVTYSVKKVLAPDYLKRVEENFTLSEFSKETMVNSYYMNESVKTVLTIKRGESLYKATEKDTDKQRNKTLRGLNYSFVLAVGAYYEYYSNSLEKIQFYKAKNLGGHYELVSFEKHKWKLVEGKTSILGFACKKAIKVNMTSKKNKNETVVWYTEDIPFGFGPKDYLGLPGLILKVEKGNDTFLATKIEINPKKLEVIKPKAKLKTTLKEKRKAFQKIMNNN